MPGSPSLLSAEEILEFEARGDAGSPAPFSLKEGRSEDGSRSSLRSSSSQDGLYNPSSPSAMWNGTLFAALVDPSSPSASMPQEEAASSTTDATLRLFQPERDNDTHVSVSSVPMKKATCQRASRAARANDPSSEATMQAYNTMYTKFQEIKQAKIERAPRESQAFKSFKPPSSSGGKGAAVRTSQQNQSKMNHLASLKAKDIDTNNTEPAFLLGGFTAPVLWDRLAENSLRSNAVNSSVSIPLCTLEHTIFRLADTCPLLCTGDESQENAG